MVNHDRLLVRGFAPKVGGYRVESTEALFKSVCVPHFPAEKSIRSRIKQVDLDYW